MSTQASLKYPTDMGAGAGGAMRRPLGGELSGARDRPNDRYETSLQCRPAWMWAVHLSRTVPRSRHSTGTSWGRLPRKASRPCSHPYLLRAPGAHPQLPRLHAAPLLLTRGRPVTGLPPNPMRAGAVSSSPGRPAVRGDPAAVFQAPC